MNHTPIIALSIAIVSSLWTWWPSHETRTPESKPDTQVLTADGTPVQGESIAGIRVVTRDATTGEPIPFEVRRAKGEWTIPSHFDYPADGGTQVGETAGAVLNMPMGPLVSDDKARYAEYGVEDPLMPTSGGGAGKRVTLTDEGGAVLVDVIIGKKKPGTDVYFVRRANEARIYTARVQPENIKPDFESWVETSLLKLAQSEVREVTIKDYSVNEEAGTVDKRSMVVLSKAAEATDWSILPPFPGRSVNTSTVNELTEEIASLRLVGVRPYSSKWLEERGFYLGRTATAGQQLYGNEGEVQVVSRYGLVYRLYFGEIALGDEQDTQARPIKKSTPNNPIDSKHNRYMAVFVQYDPAFDESVPAPILPEPPASDAGPGGSQPDRTPTNQAQIATARAAGQTRADAAQARFGKFFYVVNDASFKKLRPKRERLYTPPSE